MFDADYPIRFAKLAGVMFHVTRNYFLAAYMLLIRN